jgi:hypothetical protein
MTVQQERIHNCAQAPIRALAIPQPLPMLRDEPLGTGEVLRHGQTWMAERVARLGLWMKEQPCARPCGDRAHHGARGACGGDPGQSRKFLLRLWLRLLLLPAVVQKRIPARPRSSLARYR